MANQIVTLKDDNNNPTFPIAGGMAEDSITTQMLKDGSVTSDKIDWTTISEELYYNASPVGSTTSIQLSSSVSNYDTIDVYFRDDQGYSNVQRVYIGGSNSVNFCLDLCKASGVSNTIFVSSKRCVVSGTTMTLDIERNATIATGAYPTVSTSSNFKVYKVVGNKLAY